MSLPGNPNLLPWALTSTEERRKMIMKLGVLINAMQDTCDDEIRMDIQKKEMRFKSNTAWKDPKYPLTIPNTVKGAIILPQQSQIVNLPSEILLKILKVLDRDHVIGAGALILTCKKVAKLQDLACVAKTNGLTQIMKWQAPNLKWCKGCGFNRPFDIAYWRSEDENVLAWPMLLSDEPDYQTTAARKADKMVDVRIWRKQWCTPTNKTYHSDDLESSDEADSYCPPCQAQWNYEMQTADWMLASNPDHGKATAMKMALEMENDREDSDTTPAHAPMQAITGIDFSSLVGGFMDTITDLVSNMENGNESEE